MTLNPPDTHWLTANRTFALMVHSPQGHDATMLWKLVYGVVTLVVLDDFFMTRRVRGEGGGGRNLERQGAGAGGVRSG